MGSLGERLGVDTDSHTNNIVKYQTSDMAVEFETVPLLQIWFLEGEGKEICGEAVAGGSRFCMSFQHELSMA